MTSSRYTLRNEKTAGAMTVARSGKSNPFDGLKYTRVHANPQGFAATAIILFEHGDGDVEWHTNTI